MEGSTNAELFKENGFVYTLIRQPPSATDTFPLKGEGSNLKVCFANFRLSIPTLRVGD